MQEKITVAMRCIKDHMLICLLKQHQLKITRFENVCQVCIKALAGLVEKNEDKKW